MDDETRNRVSLPISPSPSTIFHRNPVSLPVLPLKSHIPRRGEKPGFFAEISFPIHDFSQKPGLFAGQLLPSHIPRRGEKPGFFAEIFFTETRFVCRSAASISHPPPRGETGFLCRDLFHRNPVCLPVS
ncbi:hypothetical protein, partial [Microseira wollei]|uniref:hypothetical protein n=1 Tax=Microseira wollei TaxID=467598 RepID=UPI001CFC748E